MFSEQDKEAIQKIVKIIHYDLRFVNMDYVYSEVEQLVQNPDFATFIIKYRTCMDDNNDNDDDNDDDDIDYNDNNDIEAKVLEIFTLSMFVEKDLSDTYDEVLYAVKKWFKKWNKAK